MADKPPLIYTDEMLADAGEPLMGGHLVEYMLAQAIDMPSLHELAGMTPDERDAAAREWADTEGVRLLKGGGGEPRGFLNGA